MDKTIKEFKQDKKRLEEEIGKSLRDFSKEYNITDIRINVVEHRVVGYGSEIVGLEVDCKI